MAEDGKGLIGPLPFLPAKHKEGITIMTGSLKLVSLIETKAEAIAKQWAKDVRKNARTSSYHDIPESTLVPMAVRFYDNFSQMFYTDKPAEISRPYFAQYAEEHYRHGIPLWEALYALILMRRHIWLYAEFQTIFISAVEQKQAVDSLVRTILMFDYAITFISQRYQELTRSEIDGKLGILNLMVKENPLRTKVERYKSVIMAILLLGVMSITSYTHGVMGTNIIITHLFYIPIVLGGLWWQRKGIWIALILSVYLLINHVLFLQGIPIYDDLIRAAMFLIIGSVVAVMSEGLHRAEEILKGLNTKGVS